MATLYQHSLSKLNKNIRSPSPQGSVDSDPGYGTLESPRKVKYVNLCAEIVTEIYVSNAYNMSKYYLEDRRTCCCNREGWDRVLSPM